MRWRSDGPRGFGNRVQFNGPLDLRAPEHRFATDSRIDARFRLPIENIEIDDRTNEFFWAWQNGDDVAARRKAEELLGLTGAHFQRQGVPVFARPILPPQLAGHVADSLRSLPKPQQATEFERLLQVFEPNARRRVSQEVSQLMSSPTGAATPTGGATRTGTATRSGPGGSIQNISDAPTWKPQPRFLENLFEERPRVSTNANERSWDRELQARAQEGRRIRNN